MAPARPNILLITTDQHHYTGLGVNNPVLRTPNLDGLSRQGALFSRAYCPNPLCSPSRSSIVTGKYPSSHGCWTLGTKLDEETPTLGAMLGAAGYQTSLIGKAHFQPLASVDGQTSLECPPVLRDLDFWRGFHGPYYGFDHIELARNHADEYWVGQHYAIWMEENGLSNWRDYFQNEARTNRRRHHWDLPEEMHYTTWTAERSIAAIDRAVDAGQPFFTWASFHDPHPPYLAPEPWASMYDPADVKPGTLAPGELDRMPPWFAMTQDPSADFGRWQETPYLNHGFGYHPVADDLMRKDIAVYYGMISMVDAAVGRILERLDHHGEAENTIIVFTTDHGHFLGQHGLTRKGPFHYEDLLRIPMIVRHPGHVPAGSQVSALQSLVDFAPTFLSAAGLDVPLDMQGVDQTAVWRGQSQAARNHVVAENRHQPTEVHIRTYIDEQHKMTLYRDQPWGELFDLHADPHERNNLFDAPEAAPLRSDVLHRFMNAELSREASQYARIAAA